MAEKKEGAAKVKRKKTSKRYENYEVSGSELKRKNKTCPKCGAGIFLANHKNRLYCGQCHYSEFTKTQEKQEVKEG